MKQTLSSFIFKIRIILKLDINLYFPLVCYFHSFTPIVWINASHLPSPRPMDRILKDNRIQSLSSRILVYCGTEIGKGKIPLWYGNAVIEKWTKNNEVTEERWSWGMREDFIDQEMEIRQELLLSLTTLNSSSPPTQNFNATQELDPIIWSLPW